MKKYIWGVLSACMLLTGCQPSQPTTEQVDLTVFAAASLTESLNEIKTVYEKAHPEINLVYNFDSSGTLQTQIEAGAVCDVFLSAGSKQMDALTELIENRVNLLQNTVVLIAPKDAENPPASFADLPSVSMIALGNADVPVGQYAEEILRSLNLWDTLYANQQITFASNVKEVTAQVASGAVDCGIVYRTDAASEPHVQVIAEAPADSYSPAIYPAATLKHSAHPEEAEAFLQALQEDAAFEIFSAVGFTQP